MDWIWIDVQYVKFNPRILLANLSPSLVLFEVMHLHEKNEGHNINLNMVAKFREAVEACNLVCMGF